MIRGSVSEHFSAGRKGRKRQFRHAEQLQRPWLVCDSRISFSQEDEGDSRNDSHVSDFGVFVAKDGFTPG